MYKKVLLPIAVLTIVLTAVFTVVDNVSAWWSYLSISDSKLSTGNWQMSVSDSNNSVYVAFQHSASLCDPRIAETGRLLTDTNGKGGTFSLYNLPSGNVQLTVMPEGRLSFSYIINRFGRNLTATNGIETDSYVGKGCLCETETNTTIPSYGPNY